MSPPFIFKIDEIRENPHITPLANGGHWIPHTVKDYNYRLSTEGITGQFWFCDQLRIRSVPASGVPNPLNPYKTFSVFYSAGRGFWVLRGDGTAPLPSENWNPLRFDHDGTDYSSYLTSAGTEDAMRCHRTDQMWATQLLPNIYHGPPTSVPQYGGLRGDLPIFLALVALSMQPAALPQWLPWMFQGGQWNMHALSNGWTHKRGVVVDVYHCPSSWADGGDAQALTDYENGLLGKYYH